MMGCLTVAASMGTILLIGLGMTQDWSVAAVLGITLIRAAAIIDVASHRCSIPCAMSDGPRFHKVSEEGAITCLDERTGAVISGPMETGIGRTWPSAVLPTGPSPSPTKYSTTPMCSRLVAVSALQNSLQ
jgi:hypothetical protein